jgi:hypothetical protein
MEELAWLPSNAVSLEMSSPGINENGVGEGPFCICVSTHGLHVSFRAYCLNIASHSIKIPHECTSSQFFT